MERVIWAQKAGINWRKFSDWNTKYFHTLEKVKKSRSKILCLKDEMMCGFMIRKLLSLWQEPILSLSLLPTP